MLQIITLLAKAPESGPLDWDYSSFFNGLIRKKLDAMVSGQTSKLNISFRCNSVVFKSQKYEPSAILFGLDGMR